MKPSKNLLIVDDEADIRSLISRYFGRRNFSVFGAESGEQMREILTTHPIDIILLDVCLPDTSGFELLSEIRAQYSGAVIMLTALAKTEQRIDGLNRGADDYLPKPFDLDELEARIHAVLRRNVPAGGNLTPPKRYRFAGFELDTGQRSLRQQNGTDIKLTPAQYELLLVLLKHPGVVLDRDFLMLSSRGRQANIHDRAIDVRLSQLRKKLPGEHPQKPLFLTIRGGGYMLDCDVIETDIPPATRINEPAYPKL